MGCASSKTSTTEVSLKDVALKEIGLDKKAVRRIVKSIVEPGAGCRIPKTEERGITLKQLGKVKQQVQSRCEKEGWRAWNPALQQLEKEPLTPEQVTLYVVCEKVIKPATRAKQTSFVELVAFGPQPPTWFVSHWWGEPVFDMISCLVQHGRDHKYEEKIFKGYEWTGEWETKVECAYWVCAYGACAPPLCIWPRQRALAPQPPLVSARRRSQQPVAAGRGARERPEPDLVSEGT